MWASWVGEAGLSEQEDDGGSNSREDEELEYRRWPRWEKVGVTGEPMSDEEEPLSM